MNSYLIHSTVLLSGLMIFYWLFLRHETFFALNRWTFVFCIILSLALPTISVPASLSLQQKFKAIPEAFSDFSAPTKEKSDYEVTKSKDDARADNTSPVVAESHGPLSVKALKNWSLRSILFGIYLIGVAIFLIVFAIQLLVLLTRKYNLNSVKTGKYTIVELVKEQEPYSFMNTIFINPQSYDEETYEQIIEHEKLHVDQGHFVDKLLAEFLVILFWFNPLIWLMRSSIGKNLEFLTDHTLLRKGIEKESYQMSLLKVSVSTQPFNLTTSYNNSFLKNRIIMMNSKKSSIASLWKYLFILPLFFLSMISLNAVHDESQSEIESIQVEQNSESKASALPAEKPKASAKPRAAKNGKWVDLRPNQPGNTKRELNLAKITSFNIANKANVVVKKSNEQKIVVEGPSHLIDKLNLDVDNGDWNIKIMDPDRNGKTDEFISIIMSVVELKAVAISGEGNIAGEGTFKTPGNNMSVAISGSGNIKLDVESSKTNCAISGQGNVVINGKSDIINIALSGSGNVSTLDLKADEASIAVSGSGKIAVNAEKKLTTTVSGYAEIEYSGNPQIKSKASGQAKVNRI